MPGSAISQSGCRALSESSRQGVSCADSRLAKPHRQVRDSRSPSHWRLILALDGLFTIDVACHRTGISWRNAHKVIAGLHRRGALQIVGSERRRHGNRAPVYRVVPAADRSRLRRRARPIQPSVPSVPSDLSEVLA